MKYILRGVGVDCMNARHVFLFEHTEYLKMISERLKEWNIGRLEERKIGTQKDWNLERLD